MAVVVLCHQPLVNWILVVFAVLFVCGGTLYMRMADLERVARAMVLKRRTPAIRAIFGAMLILSVWIIWVAITK